MKLSKILMGLYSERRAPLYRGDGELSFLMEWLERDKSGDAAPADADIPDLSLPETIETCGRCSDITERKKSYGSGVNGVMVILNTPGLISRDEREIYRSSSIDLLKKIIEALKLNFDHCYTTNLIKCETSDLLQRPSLMLSNCMDIFIREIKETAPRLVIVMGDMHPFQKYVQDNPGIPWFNIHHPITMIKNSELKRPAWNTLKLVIEKLNELGIDRI